MSLVFLAPLFLAGLAALAVPVLIHLTHKERKEPIAFPSLMFLEQVPFRTERRQRIRHWLLFLLRAFAVLLIVAAFARPLLQGGPVGAVTRGAARDVVLLLDRSASMGYADRWQRATEAANAAVRSLGPDDRMTVVAFADRPEALNQPIGDAATLAAAIGTVAPTGTRTAYGTALRLAGELLEDTDRAPEVVLVTDLQRTGWDPQTVTRLPPGTRVVVHDVGTDDAPNRAVAGVMLDRSRADGRERITVAARVLQHGGTDSIEIPVRFELAGQAIQEVTVTVPPDGDAVARFAAVQDPERDTPARIVMDDDALPADDAWHFVLRPTPSVAVLLARPPGANDEALYVTEALSVAHDPVFPVTVRTPTAVQPGDLDAADVVILHGTPFPGGAAGRRLLDFVAGGGGLLMTLGPREATLPAALADSLGAPAQMPTDRLSDMGSTAGVTDYQHPVFAPFRGSGSGDISAARIFRYRALAAPAGEVLARYDDGATALVSLGWGAGRVLVWTSDFGNRWNDLPLRPVFVPFLLSATRWLGRHTPPPAARPAGGVVALAELVSDTTEALVLEFPDGHRTRVGPEGDPHVTLDQPGLYTLRPVADRTTPVALFAVNGDPAESDLTRTDRDELIAAAEPLGDAEPTAAAGAAQLTSSERERRQGLWWYLLAGVLALLAAETVVAQRARRAA